MPLIECVPNVSEGRRADVIAAIAAAIAAPGVHLLDQIVRSVAQPDRLHVRGRARRRARRRASAVRRRHRRNRPARRTKACIRASAPSTSCRSCRSTDATMDECVALATEHGSTVADRFGCRCFCTRRPQRPTSGGTSRTCGAAASTGSRIRMRQPAWRPDFGPDRPHPSAGATAIGARPILIAYNVNLASNRLSVAKRIASVIRASGGGLPLRQSDGRAARARGIVQVSMNLTNYKETSMAAVFDAIAREAAADGVRILESEIVGLVPADALPARPGETVEVAAEDLDRVLEARLETSSEDRKARST